MNLHLTALKPIAAATIALSAATLALPAHADSDTQDENVLQKAGDYVSDASLTAKIKAEFVENDSLSALDIEVESTDGVVTLAGDVKSDDQKDLAEDVAETVDGVKDVHNELRVASAD